MRLIYLNSALKYDSFDVTSGIKIPFFRVLFTIEPGRSLLQFVTTYCLTSRPNIGSVFLEKICLGASSFLIYLNIKSSSLIQYEFIRCCFSHCLIDADMSAMYCTGLL